MVRVINGSIERIVPRDALRKWMQDGYKPLDPLPELAELTTEPAPDPEPEKESETQEEPIEIPNDLESMKTRELRKLADKIGVQGYQNMDKATLIAVIQNH